MKKTLLGFAFAAVLGLSATAQAANPKVLIETTKGNITVELDAEKAPKTVENFLGYVKDDFYKETIFHWVIAGFMVQGGGMTADLSEKAKKASIKNEANNGLKNTRGTIAMARTPDPDSASSQFFINLVDNDFLNFKSETPQGWGYAVFGKVTEGMDVLKNIEANGTRSGGTKAPIKIEDCGQL